MSMRTTDISRRKHSRIFDIWHSHSIRKNGIEKFFASVGGRYQVESYFAIFCLPFMNGWKTGTNTLIVGWTNEWARELWWRLWTFDVHFIHGWHHELVHSVDGMSRAPSTSVFAMSQCPFVDSIFSHCTIFYMPFHLFSFQLMFLKLYKL